MMLNPKNKWSEPEKSNTMKAECPESKMQDAVDEYLDIKRIQYIRVPDVLWRWIKVNAPGWAMRWLGKILGGLPDNTCSIPIGNGYALTLLIELKTQDSKGRAVGRLHGKQKHHADEWCVCRSVNAAIEKINEFEKLAECLKKQSVTDKLDGIFIKHLI